MARFPAGDVGSLSHGVGSVVSLVYNLSIDRVFWIVSWWSTYVLVPHLLYGGRPAFDFGAHAFLFGFGPPASGVWGRNSSGLYRILFESPLVRASLFQLIPVSFSSTMAFWLELLHHRDARLHYSLHGVISPRNFPIRVMNGFVCVWWCDVIRWDIDWSMMLSKDVNQVDWRIWRRSRIGSMDAPRWKEIRWWRWFGSNLVESVVVKLFPVRFRWSLCFPVTISKLE